jgi:hypothetical protein
MSPEEYRAEQWSEIEDPLGDLKFVNTFTRSLFPKSERAMKLMEQIVKKEFPRLTLDQLNAEYRRINHAEICFKSKEAAIRAIKELSGLRLGVGKNAKAGKGAPTPKAQGADIGRGVKETRGRPRTKPTKERLERAKKIAAAKKGVGAMIVELLKKGGDNETIASAALKKFPKKTTLNANRVAWYRSMLRTANVKGV